MAKTIRFKSTPDNWKKEYLGLKRNTIRIFIKGYTGEEEDIREEILKCFINGTCNLINIEIENTKTMETFIRSITDVTKFENYYIISW